MFDWFIDIYHVFITCIGLIVMGEYLFCFYSKNSL